MQMKADNRKFNCDVYYKNVKVSIREPRLRKSLDPVDVFMYN